MTELIFLGIINLCSIVFAVIIARRIPQIIKTQQKVIQKSKENHLSYPRIHIYRGLYLVGTFALVAFSVFIYLLIVSP